MPSLILHVANSEPVKVDVDELPDPQDVAIIGSYPRDRADKEVPWLEDGVTTVIFPWWRINYVQVLPDDGEQSEFPELFRD